MALDKNGDGVISTVVTGKVNLSLTVNIENTSCKPESITLEEFYIVSGGEKFLPTKWQEYNEVEILSMSTRSCEQKWKCDSSHFITKGDYVIITLKSREDTHVFKFVYKGRRFSLDDYFKNFGEQGNTVNVVNTNEYPETHSDSTEGAYMGDSNQ